MESLCEKPAHGANSWEKVGQTPMPEPLPGEVRPLHPLDIFFAWHKESRRPPLDGPPYSDFRKKRPKDQHQIQEQ